VGQVRRFVATSKYGILRFGFDPRDGHTGWRFEHSGGAIILPHVVLSETLYVGLLPEARVNLGGTYPCAIGGFKNPHETHEVVVRRETHDEAQADVSTPVPVLGLPMAIDRNYFEVDIAAGQGLKVFAAKLPPGEMQPAPDGSFTHPNWKAKNGTDVQFRPWHEAIVSTPDLIAVGGIGRLAAQILQK
jgi:hypothetical protein